MLRLLPIAVVCAALVPARAAAQEPPVDEPPAETAQETTGPGGGEGGETAASADDAVAEDVVASFGTVVGTADPATTPPQTRHRITWREDWPRFSFDEAVLSLGMGALLVAAELLPTSTTSANWTGGILFDQPVRDGLRLRSHDGRESALIASEVLQWVLITMPFAVDALAVVGIGDGNWDAAFQMGLIALESYVIALTVWKIVTLLARRERPVASACAQGLDSPHCDAEFTTTSFFSNQTMNAFTGASLVCLHHTHMPIFGDEAADVSACVGGLTVAAMVGLLRVMSDFEYLTDVLMGAIVGFLSGYVIPWVVHYQGGARPELRAPVAAIPVPYVGGNDAYGLAVAGWF